MIYDILNKCYLNSYVITINIDLYDWDKLLVGIISSLTNDSLELEVLNPFGISLKIKKIKIKSIKMINYDDIYGNDLRILYEINKDKKPLKSIYINHSNTKSFIKKIQRIKELKEVISVFIMDNYQIGRIKEINEHYLYINNISYQGLNDGVSALPIDKISKIRLHGMVESKVSYLHDVKNK